MVASAHMRKVYDTKLWRRVRLLRLELAGWRCEYIEPWSLQRCTVTDKRIGGTESLTVDHTRPDVDPYDVTWLKALCHHHHGKKDGPRARRRTK